MPQNQSRNRPRQTMRTNYNAAQNLKASVRPKVSRPVKKGPKIRWAKICVFVFALYCMIHLISGFFSIVDLKQKQAEVNDRIVAAQNEQDELKEKIRYMSTEPAIEKVAREKLGLIKPDEIVVLRAKSAD